jgi:hypothetical protein
LVSGEDRPVVCEKQGFSIGPQVEDNKEKGVKFSSGYGLKRSRQEKGRAKLEFKNIHKHYGYTYSA